MNIFRNYTLKSLRQNRTRTVVTVIGIILSVAMITAVTTTVSSIQNFMLEATVQNDGCWHVNLTADQEEPVKEALEKEEVDENAVYADITYAKLEKVKRERIPYLFIGGVSGDFEKLLTVRRIWQSGQGSIIKWERRLHWRQGCEKKMRAMR